MRTLRLLLVSALAATGLSIAVAAPADAAATVSGFAQCENGTGTAVTCTGGWVNGSLGTSNSHFTEDQVVPQRALISLPADNLEHSLTFTYQDRKGSIHAYDSLATWNKTVSAANPCQGIAAALCSAAPSQIPMTSDPALNIPPTAGGNLPKVSAHELDPVDRKWTMYGAVLTTDVAATHSSPAAGDDLVTVTVKFRNATPGAATTGVLLFGGHLAVGGPNAAPRAWGQNLGASSVSGGPYAFKLEQVDGNSTGATANSIKAGGIAPLPPAVFSITKTASSGTASAGGQISYTVTVKNTGGVAGSTTFVDDYNNDLTSVSTPNGCVNGAGSMSCTTGTIQPGGQQVFVYTANMPATFSGGANTGTCTGGTYPVSNTATLANNTSATALVCVSASAQFSVTKTASPTNPNPGQTVTYTITVTNSGTASGATSFTDDYDNQLSPTVPNGCTDNDDVLSCTTDSIAANGGTQVFGYTAVMPASFDGGATCTGGYKISNKVTLTGGAEVTRDVCVQAAPAFTVAKTASVAIAQPGDTVTYTLTVTNNGKASGSTSVTDTPAAGVTLGALPIGCSSNANGSFTCTTGAILAGANKVFSYTATMPSTFDGQSGGGDCATGTFPITNTAVVGTSSSSKTVCVSAAPAFTITKTADPLTATPGQTVNYTVKVKNIGAASGSTTFTDDYADSITPTLPTSATTGSCTQGVGQFNCTTGKLLSGVTVTFTYSATMPASFPSGSPTGTCPAGSFSVANTATLAGGSAAGAEICVAASPAFKVTKSVDDDEVGAGDSVTYTITVKNTGTAAGTTVFTDDFDDRLSPSDAVSVPAGNTCSPTNNAGAKSFQCTTGTINPGQTQTFTYTAAMPASFTGESGGDVCDDGSYPVHNAVVVGVSQAAVDVCVAAAPDFTIRKSADSSVAGPGTEVEYTIIVKNTGDAAGATTFTDDYDATATVAAAPDGCTLDLPGTAFTCTTGTINAGQTQTFVYTATMPSTFTGSPDADACHPPAYPIVNTVTLANEDSSGVTICVAAGPLFAVTKTVDKPDAQPGDTVHYTVTVTNEGAAAGSTTIVDDYDNRLTPTVPLGCTDANGKLTCTTDVLLSGASQSFEYDAVLPVVYSGASGVEPCAPGEYSIVNAVTLNQQEVASQTVCVAAAPKFTVAKTADDITATPGQVVTYKITVANTGSVAGSTTAVDDYDNRLTPTVPVGCSDADGKLTCTTEVLQPGTEQVFTYTATMPATYTGPAGAGGCANGSYPVANSVVLTNGANASVTVCSAAVPVLSLSKTAALDTSGNGDQTLTYTLTYTNSGAAEALGTVVTDPVPAGAGFVSCTPACTTPNGVATWNVGAVAPAGGTGTLVLVVRVNSNQVCVITNTAQIKADGATTASSNTVSTNVSPQPDVANAKASGSAIGLSITTAGLLDLVGPIVGGSFTNGNTLTLTHASSSQSGLGGPNVNSASLLSAKIPGNGSLVTAGVLTATSASSVTASPAEARNTTTSEVAGVCLVPVAGLCTVESNTVRAVATTMANGGFAAVSTAGSAIENLRVAGVAVPLNLNQTTTIPLNKTIFGKNSYVAINERTSSAGLSGQKYVADQSVAMIHVKITGVLGLQAVEIYVAKAVAHSEFPKTFLCAGAANRSVSGHAYTARLYTGPLLADLLQGYVQISPLGGAESEHVAQAVIPSTGVILNAKVADSNTSGSFNATSSTARSWAEVAGDGTKPACLLSYVTNCVAKATLIRSEVRSTANAAGSTSTDTGTSFVGLQVFGLPITVQPAPNTVLALPGIGFIILNEQFCDNGALASHSCTAAGHTGMTVRAVRVVVTVANNLLGLSPGVELIVAEAHADTTFN